MVSYKEKVLHHENSEIWEKGPEGTRVGFLHYKNMPLTHTQCVVESPASQIFKAQ